MAVDSSTFMTELAGSNQHTAQAFEQAAQQIHITNESLQKIHDDARQKVEGVIQNLSSISEENAASTEETTASMTQLNETIKQLAKESELLRKSADQLKNNLEFFNL